MGFWPNKFRFKKTDLRIFTFQTDLNLSKNKGNISQTHGQLPVVSRYLCYSTINAKKKQFLLLLFTLPLGRP